MINKSIMTRFDFLKTCGIIVLGISGSLSLILMGIFIAIVYLMGCNI